MLEQNRRSAMGTMAALWVSACGGGGEESAAQTVESLATPAEPQVAALGPSAKVQPAASPEAQMAVSSRVMGDLRQFLTWDGGDGPAREYWSRHLLLAWKNFGSGDWIDANGLPQGTAAYAMQAITAQGAWFDLDVTALVRKCVASGEHKGFMLRSNSVSGAKFGGRESANPPQLIVDGKAMPLHAFSCFSRSSSSGIDSRQLVTVQASTSGIAQFDLRLLRSASHAVLRLYCERKYSTTPTVQVFEVDAPRISIGADRAALLGIAAEAGSEAALKAHPDVLRAGDFSDLTKGVVFDTFSFAEDAERGGAPVCTQLPDPDAPGSTMLRGYFRAGTWDEGEKRGSCSFKTEHMRASYDDPLRPAKVVEETMFARLYVFLEDDWNSARDGNKMAIGWDLRMGWWNNARGGYWQSTTGNGGARGTGLKLFAPKRDNGSSQAYDCWEYQGHSIRMEAGKASVTGNPYGELRPVQSYVYNLDQPTSYGDMVRIGAACIRKGRWFCVEQQVKMNSVVGPYDEYGNGQAVADGVLRTWIDGVLSSEVTDLRWRRHAEMGIQGPWINWYFGGKQPSDVEMHYRMNHFACARKYIGPRIG